MRRKWSFDNGRGGFRYDDDVFRLTDAPDAARGVHAPTGGHGGGGALSVRLGGVEDARGGMSGGWTRAFEVEETQRVVLTFKFKMKQSADYDVGEFADLRVALDGEMLEVGGKPYVARLKGDGPGGEATKTGWRTVEIDLGALAAGGHEITLGGFGNRAASQDAFTRIVFDDVKLAAAPPRKPAKLDPFEAEVLERTNAFREKHGRDPLTADRNLTEAAEDWSREMAKGDFFRHSDKPGQITEHGYDPAGWGENIAAGYATPKSVVKGWKDSPGHRANLLREDFEHIGVGYYFQKNDGGAAPYGHYWTQIFGTPSDDYF